MAGTLIRDVSDTALWVAMYRALESERPDALFVDRFARRLAGERGETIVRSLPGASSLAWPMIVRTVAMDEIVLRLVRQGVRTVLNLAAGLDTRPFRLDLPTDLHWLHVDLPAMVEYVEERMAGEAPRCRLERIAADLTDAAARRSVFSRVAVDGPALVITEGLLIYLEELEVAALARQIHAIPGLRWWLTDLTGPTIARMLSRRVGKGLAGNAPFRFTPADGGGRFAGWGFREVEYRSIWYESLRLGRSFRGSWLLALLGRLSSRTRREKIGRMAGIVLFERAALESTEVDAFSGRSAR